MPLLTYTKRRRFPIINVKSISNLIEPEAYVQDCPERGEQVKKFYLFEKIIVKFYNIMCFISVYGFPPWRRNNDSKLCRKN